METKKHFDILDGLRGIAALAVVTFHFMEMAISDYSKNFIGHGFLAVDFFFCLSGFVIAYAYDERIKTMGLGAFFKARLIRLHPLVIFGSVLGLLSFLFDPFGGHPELYSAGKIALIFLCSIFLFPFPVMPERSFNLFGLNAPCWSLFWEYIANIFYAFILCRIRRGWLVFLVIISALALCLVAHRAGSLMGGWDGKSFWDGGVRVSYSFLAGLLIYRSGWIIRNRLGFAGLSVLLLLAFLTPFSRWNWLTEPVIVLIYFPLLIALGAGAVLTPGLRKLCIFSGRISYPLYMTHYMAIWVFGHYYDRHKPGSGQLFLIVTISIVVLVALASVVMEVYDTPVRRFLGKRKE